MAAATPRLPLVFIVGIALGTFACECAAAETRPNVLLILVDDLRPLLGCYGQTQIHSPNVDRLAASSLVFERAYCQQAVCNPSRASMLSGCRPDTTGVMNNQTFLRPNMPEVVTLPQHFKNHGFHAISLGKIFHHSQREPGDDPQSWSEPSWYNGGSTRSWFSQESLDYIARLKALPEKERPRLLRGPPFEAANEPDDAYQDGALAAQAVKTLQRIKDQPFFLGVGFHKPHLPFCCPQRYWDLYPADNIKLPKNYEPPKNVPEPALHNWYELRTYGGIPAEGGISDETALSLIRGYRACVSFVDAQIGRVLDELDRLELTEKTIVVLWGDHGYHLGENGIFTKMTNFELGTRTPLIVRVPGQKTAGKRASALVEAVDIYPTLAELCELPLPAHLEGTSFAPLVVQPELPWKTAAFSQYLRPGRKPNPAVMGRSIRTDRWRYTEWTTIGGENAGVELYDHQTDPAENTNIAGEATNRAVVEELAERLRAGWKAALPPSAKAGTMRAATASPPRAAEPDTSTDVDLGAFEGNDLGGWTMSGDAFSA
ncbi:MAG: sulfatase, partial [Planctomycetota bacterium]